MMKFIPAIDIIDGKCVRLTMGDYNQKSSYHANPLEVAKQFESAGVKRLHLVDLDGAKAKKLVNLSVLEQIANQTSLIVDFGGGIQSDEAIKNAFDAGAEMITAGSVAVKNEEMVLGWVSHYGAHKIILGADAKDRKIAVSGWQEQADWEIFDFIKHYKSKGLNQVISTDISKDGMMQGPSFKLYQEMKDRFNDLKIIASGGVSNMKDIEQLNQLDLEGVIVGKAFYEGAISIKEIESYHRKYT